MLRVLHTSDWHLGASLEGISRDDDHARFLTWLTETLAREKVDVLVIAGDVFDQAHPSAEAQRLFFTFLRGISGIGLRKVVIVGGNHDSPSRLDAPREVLEALDIHVVGGLGPEDSGWDRCICPVPGERGGVDAVVLAVPFVHEYRLGIRTVLSSAEEIRDGFRAKFRDLYRKLVDRARSLHDGAPAIATGHLTCDGWEKGDAPADIHMVGTIGGLPADIFDERLQYVALGHIHRSYRVGQSRAYYSGTPLSLCLKEGKTARTVRLVELNASVDAPATVRTLEVPCFRDIVEVAGPLDEVTASLRTLTWETALPPIVYARVFVDRYAASVDDAVRKAAQAHGADGPRLVQIRQALLQPPLEAAAGRGTSVESLRDLDPEEVFLRLCRDRQEPVDPQLLNAFRSLLTSEEVEVPTQAQVAR